MKTATHAHVVNRLRLCVLLCIALGLVFKGHAQVNPTIVFPDSAKVLDVTKPPYNADKTGTTDATAAIQAALNTGARLIYVPNGTYLVSDTLEWAGNNSTGQKRQILQGQSRDGTIIKLKDNTAAYSSASTTRPVIFVGTAPAQRFRNSIRNLTLNTGSGNPGATGIQYIANNQGAMYDVLIKSGDGNGVIGLDLGYTNEQGPCLIKRIEVQGFDTGIRTKFGVDGVVMEDITVKNQKVVGILNDGQCFSIENLRTEGTVTGFRNIGSGLLAIINSTFVGSGGASSLPAIVNTNGLFARNITTTGFAKAIDNSGANGGKKLIDSTNISEFTSHDVLSLFPSPKRSLNLPFKQTPEVPWDALTDWVNVKDYASFAKDTSLVFNDGSTRVKKDWTQAIQRAIDAGKKTVYFPQSGNFDFFGTVYVRGEVRRIIGMDGIEIKAQDSHYGRWRIENGTAPTVVIERFDSFYAGFNLTNNSNRNVVVKNMALSTLNNLSGKGDVFLEDVTTKYGVKVGAGSAVYARQHNPENDQTGQDNVTNEGGTYWVLGLKTENDVTAVSTKTGGKTEVIGGFIYANKNFDANKVMFRNDEGSQFSGTVGEQVIRNQPFNPVQETREGITQLLKPGVAPGRGGGSMLVLYTGYRPAASATPNGAPTALTGNAPRYDQIKISWTDNSTNEEGFVVERKVGSGSFAPYKYTIAGVRTLNDSSLTASTTYAYRVRAVNAAGRSAYTNELSLTTPAAPAAPAAPTGLGVTVNTGFDITVTWTDNSNSESGFKLERKATSDTDFIEIAQLGANITQYVQRSQLASTTYQYRVRSYFEVSNSAYSNVASVTTAAGEEMLVHWTFDETTGTVASDFSGHGYAGTLAGGVTYGANSVTGTINNALQLDGSDDVVRRNEKLAISSYPFTMSVWIKTTSTAGTAVFYGSSGASDHYYGLGVDASGKAKLTYRQYNVGGNVENVATGSTVNNGQWHLLTGVWESASSLKLYVDGTLGATLANNLTYYGSENRFSVGALDHSLFKERFSGAVDDARFYGRALSASEVSSLYAGGSTPPETVAAPTSLTATATASSVTLTWTDNASNEQGFVVERKTGASGTYAPIDTLGANTVTFTNTGLPAATNYGYRVRAFKNTTYSGYSNEIAISTTSTPLTIAQYTFPVNVLTSSDTETHSTAGNFTDGPGLSGGTAFLQNGRSVAAPVLTSTIQNAITNQDYFEFTVTPGTGYSFDLNSISLTAKRGSASPDQLRIYHSLDNYSSYFATGLSTNWTTYNWDLSALAETSTAVTFRIYIFGNNTGGTDDAKKAYLDDVVVTSKVINTGGARQAAVEKAEAERPAELPTVVFPNPSSGAISLRVYLPQDESVRLELLNALGRSEYNTQRQGIMGENTFQLRTNLVPGIYLLQVTTPQRREVKKVVIR